MMISDRGFEEVVPADLSRIFFHLKIDLCTAKALVIRIAVKDSLAAEMPLQIAGNLEDGDRSFLHFTMNCDADARFEVRVE